jgi:2-polyprenyl-6-methoxyphenol hydroxylase-like FAD-dependent oxidoreductase
MPSDIECYFLDMNSQTILIVGAGIAGSAAAALLGRAGHDVTLVERSARTRSSGSPVDIRGDALPVADQLGILRELRAADTGVRRVRFVNAAGRTSASAVMRPSASRDLEVPRAELGRILRSAAESVAELIDGDEPESIEESRDGAVVTFRSGVRRRFDLVVGADGQHSTVRRLVWGPEAEFSTPFGLVIATARLPLESEPTEVLLHNEPGVSVGIHPAGGHPVASFIFRADLAEAPRDRDAQEDLIRERYRSVGWRAAELVSALPSSPDLYLDVVQRVRVPSWSRKHVVFLGDAASSITILGEGSSMAIAGAARLEEALRLQPELPHALASYESTHRPTVERIQRGARIGASVLVPGSTAGIALRDLWVRLARRV